MLLKKIYITGLSTEFCRIFQNRFFINEWFFIASGAWIDSLDKYLLKVNNKDTRTRSIYDDLVVNFKQIFIHFVYISNDWISLVFAVAEGCH